MKLEFVSSKVTFGNASPRVQDKDTSVKPDNLRAMPQTPDLYICTTHPEHIHIHE